MDGCSWFLDNWTAKDAIFCASFALGIVSFMCLLTPGSFVDDLQKSMFSVNPANHRPQHDCISPFSGNDVFLTVCSPSLGHIFCYINIKLSMLWSDYQREKWRFEQLKRGRPES